MSKPFIRVYEYVDDEGTTYWSFTKQPTTISKPLRLVLQDRTGIVLQQYLVQLRLRGLALLRMFNNPPPPSGDTQ